MGGYFFIKVVPTAGLLPANASQIFSVPDRMALLFPDLARPRKELIFADLPMRREHDTRIIHLRSLGENVRRMTLCMDFAELALQLYRSAEPTWRKLAAKLPIDDPPMLDKSEKEMRALELTAPFAAARKAVIEKYHVLTELESTMWSKKSHGDVYALVQVSANLIARKSDIRHSINRLASSERETNGNLMRVVGFSLMGLSVLRSTFGIESGGQIEALAEEYGEMQKRDEQSGVLKTPSARPNAIVAS